MPSGHPGNYGGLTDVTPNGKLINGLQMGQLRCSWGHRDRSCLRTGGAGEYS
jgi:hypothetical protein